MLRGMGDFTAPGSEATSSGCGRRLRGGWKVFGDLLLRASGQHAARVIFHVPTGLGVRVLLFDEQPFVALAAIAHPHQREFAFELFAMHPELEIAALDLCGSGRVAEQLVRAAVPQHNASAAVFALGNVAFKIPVVERMILDVHGQVLRQRLQAGAFRHGPGFQSPVHFEAEIIMEPRRVVPLHAEEIAARCGPAIRLRLWLGRFIEGSFAAVFFERHPRRLLSFYASNRSILVRRMRSRLANVVACVLAVLFLGQPIALTALAGLQPTAAPCCKSSCCCRRSHHMAGGDGPALTAGSPCGECCHVSVQNTGRIAAIAPPVSAPVALEAGVRPDSSRLHSSFRTNLDPSLYQRPPPSLA